MTEAAALPTRPSLRDELRPIPLLGFTFIFCVFTASNFLFKAWYIATALALAATGVCVAAGALCTRGIMRTLAPTIAYFLVLLSTIVWAAYPHEVVRWVAIDSIEIAVVALAFLAARNSTPRKCMLAMFVIVIPSYVVAAVMYVANPNVTRLADLALPLMPMVIVFAWAYLSIAEKKWPAVVAMSLAFALLLAARSRTPIAGSIIGSALCALAYSRNALHVLKRMIAAGLAAAAVVGVLLIFAPTRAMLLTTYVRITYEDVVWGDLYIRAEQRDSERDLINEYTLRMYHQHFPQGIGYMNFMQHFRDQYGPEANLHNMYSTWVVEGGWTTIIAVLTLFVMQIAWLRRGIKYAPSHDWRAFMQAVAILWFIHLLMGLLHQVHQSPPFWMLFGLGGAGAAEARERG